MESNSIITNSVYEGVNGKKPIRRVKPKTSRPQNCYNRGQSLSNVERTLPPTIVSSSEVKTSISLLKGDCLQVMKGLPDKSVDLIICDLPYGCLTTQGKTSKMYTNKGEDNNGCSWDVKLNLELFWKEVKRIRKDDHTPCIHFCNTKFGYDLIKSNEKEFRYDLVWDKQRGVSFLSANKMPMKSHEMIYVFSKLGANYNRIDIDDETKQRKPENLLKPRKANIYTNNKLTRSQGGPNGKRCIYSVIVYKKVGVKTQSHPTEKPVDLYKFIIERYSNPGDVVLDPTFGSCNSGFACKELNRKFIGIEMNNAFFWKAVNRTAK